MPTPAIPGDASPDEVLVIAARSKAFRSLLDDVDEGVKGWFTSYFARPGTKPKHEMGEEGEGGKALLTNPKPHAVVTDQDDFADWLLTNGYEDDVQFTAQVDPGALNSALLTDSTLRDRLEQLVPGCIRQVAAVTKDRERKFLTGEDSVHPWGEQRGHKQEGPLLARAIDTDTGEVTVKQVDGVVVRRKTAPAVQVRPSAKAVNEQLDTVAARFPALTEGTTDA